jgi:pimeloyl-ACP methyl ester carboxylesterase
LNGVRTDFYEAGSGQPLLFLHGCDGPLDFSAAFLDELARDYRVIAPWHPGFGPSVRPASYRDVSDLAYFYLEFAKVLNLHDALLVGASFGGWIAAEIAVRDCSRFSGLVLADPFGVKAGGREERDYVDMFAITRQDWIEAAFHDVSKAKRDLATLTEAQLSHLVRSSESLAYYAWKPFMHNPQLAVWLHRVCVPTLVVRGAQDRIVEARCHELYASRIPDAQLAVIAAAGHYPHVEQPDAFLGELAAFLEHRKRATRNHKPLTREEARV